MNEIFLNEDVIYVKLTFYPRFISNISSYHKITINEYNELVSFINENLFIENFFRTTKNNFDFLSKEKLDIKILNEKESQLIELYLEKFGNDFNLYEMITNFYKNENISDSISSMSDEDLQDSINIIKITKYSLNNQEDKISEIIIDNPHLKENESLKDILID